MLIIEAHRERFQGADYTSASLTSRASWTYGRIEVRAKLPKGRGTWPAIWMLGTNIREVGWPACGEIDIMEHVGFDPGRIHANIHTKAYNHVQGTNKGNSLLISAAGRGVPRLLGGLDPRADRLLRGRSARTSRSPRSRAGTRCGRSTSRSTSSSISRSAEAGAVRKASTTPPSRRGS